LRKKKKKRKKSGRQGDFSAISLTLTTGGTTMMDIQELNEKTRRLQERATREVREGIFTAEEAALSLAGGMLKLQEEDRPGATINHAILLRSCQLVIDQSLPTFQGLSLSRHFGRK
jgi:hypothetical protein